MPTTSRKICEICLMSTFGVKPACYKCGKVTCRHCGGFMTSGSMKIWLCHQCDIKIRSEFIADHEERDPS